MLLDVDYSKGALSATAVFIAISAIVTTAYATGSINLVLGQFQSSSQANAIDWFGNNIASDARSMCKNNFEQSAPLANNYSRHIPGLTSIKINTSVAGTTNHFNLIFSDQVINTKETSDLYVKDPSITDLISGDETCDVEFNGSAFGDTIYNMNPSASYDYRLFSDTKNNVVIQIYESGG